MPLPSTVGRYDLMTWNQSGLSTGVLEVLPWGAAMWRRLTIMPFNLVSVTAPIPNECQIWPQYGIQMSGDPTL